MNRSEEHPISPTEARAALDQASSMHVTSPRDIRILSRVTVGIGLAMASILVLLQAAGDQKTAIFVGMTAYGVVIAALMLYNRKIGSTPRGYVWRYGLGVGLTSLVYSASTFLLAGARGTWPLAITLAVLTLLPTAIAAFSISRLAAK